jgi:hypothetical protein
MKNKYTRDNQKYGLDAHKVARIFPTNKWPDSALARSQKNTSWRAADPQAHNWRATRLTPLLLKLINLKIKTMATKFKFEIESDGLTTEQAQTFARL